MDSSLSRFAVETPEQVQLHLDVAGLGTRSMAFLVDYGVVFLTCVALILGVQFATQQSMVDWPWGTNHLLLPLVIVTLFLLFWGYFLLFEWLWNGQTPGKRALHIRVVKDGGYPISFLDSVVRNLLRIVDCYLPPFFFAIGIVCIFAHPRHKRLGDLAARTVVVLERPLNFAEIRPQPVASSAFSRVLVEPLSLSIEELELIEGYLKRRQELDPSSATVLRTEIVGYLLAKLNGNGNASSVPAENQEAFLEELIAHHTVVKPA
jgi:uncharacterized RDD family membrane protein YckC